MLRTALLALGLAGLVAPSLAAATPPPPNVQWPACSVVRPQYCVVSATKNGAAPPPSFTPYADSLDAHTMRFVLEDTTATTTATCPAGMPASDCLANLSPADTYEVVLNIGDIRPRNLSADGQDALVTTGGSAAAGYTVDLRIRPAPVSYLTGCMPGACGTDTTHGEYSYDGFVTGEVDDLSNDPDPVDFAARTGYWQVTNAQSSGGPIFDPATNQFSVQLANVHLPHVGTTAIAGSYQAFLPPAMLAGYFGIDPATASSASVAVSGAAGAPVATVTATGGGVLVSITGFHYSSPKLVVRARSIPGKARRVRASRRSRTRAAISFRAPRLTGGLHVTAYRVRCSAGSRSRSVRGRRSPLTIRGLRGGTRYRCTLRAVNARGAGRPVAFNVAAM